VLNKQLSLPLLHTISMLPLNGLMYMRPVGRISFHFAQSGALPANRRKARAQRR